MMGTDYAADIRHKEDELRRAEQNQAEIQEALREIAGQIEETEKGVDLSTLPTTDVLAYVKNRERMLAQFQPLWDAQRELRKRLEESYKIRGAAQRDLARAKSRANLPEIERRADVIRGLLEQTEEQTSAALALWGAADLGEAPMFLRQSIALHGHVAHVRKALTDEAAKKRR